MGKIAFVVAVVLAGCLSFGCSGEGPNKPPAPPTPPAELKDNVALEFRLSSGGGFAENVDAVDVGVFDVKHNHLRTQRVTDAKNIMTFAAGNYHLVFWANVDGRVRFDLDGETPTVTYSDLNDFRNTGAGEMVYYGPGSAEYYLLEVPTSGKVSDAVYLTPAHCSIDIYIAGLPPSETPTIKIDGFTIALTYFGMRPVGSMVTVSQPTTLVERDGKTYHAASFSSPLFNERELEDLSLVVDHSEGEYRVPLADALANSGSDDYDPGNLNVDLLLNFVGSRVEITIPDWSSSEVGVKK